MDMKYSRFEQFVMPALLGTTLLFASGAQAASVLLQLEESTDLKKWTPVPESQLTPAGNGAFVQTTDGSKSFYRLKIDDGGVGGASA